MKREVRVFTLDRGEVRGIGDNVSSRTFVGHASVFNSLSEELWGFHERVDPNAFDDAIAGDNDVRLLFNHDPNMILARTKSGTLKLSKDETGLVSDSDFPDTSYARDLAESMDRGDVDAMSFGFRTLEDSWEEEDHELVDGTTTTILVRTLLKVELFDVSIVVYPAYPETDAELNSHQMPAYRYLGVQPTFIPSPPEIKAAAADVTVTVSANTETFEQQLVAMEETVQGFAERVGKVLSSKNKDLLAAAGEAIDAVLAAAKDTDDAEADAAEENAGSGAAETRDNTDAETPEDPDAEEEVEAEADAEEEVEADAETDVEAETAADEAEEPAVDEEHEAGEPEAAGDAGDAAAPEEIVLDAETDGDAFGVLRSRLRLIERS